ncbi:Uncharacterised protein [Pseudomonas luteola]|uniref:Uncharacterized protein n=1 Tax=Pseudomonas luteola TaxID=47886 RepID=A0A2X2C3C6_PSELU|nr:hypothetical protein [Pseudomonas luteola]SPY99996.1 Uncharacterised protein [Pseudomonas luteola]
MGNIYILDQNVMRRPTLSEIIKREPEANFVIPDVALVEMTKNEHWEVILRESFRLLYPVTSRCFMSISVQEGLNRELTTKKSVDGKLLPYAFRDMIRSIIQGSQSDIDNPTFSLIRNNISSVQREIKVNDLNENFLRGELESRVTILKNGLTKEKLKACRNPETARAMRIQIAKDVGDGLYNQYMKSRGISRVISRRLKLQKCLTLRWAYLLAHHALHWLSDGGLDQAQEHKVVNDVLDQDYVLIATFFTGIISLETDVKKSYEDLKVMLSK